VADDDFPGWLPDMHRATPDEQQQILLAVHGELERAGLLLGAEFDRRYPDGRAFISNVGLVDYRLEVCRHVMDRIERERQMRKSPERRTPMNRRVGEVAVLYDPPSPKHRLRVRFANGKTYINYEGYRYNYNGVLPKSFARTPNFAVMCRDGMVAWSDDPSDGPKPVKLEISPPKGNPPVEVIVAGNGLDEVETLKLTYRDMIKKCAGNTAAARDLIIGDRAGNELYMRASKVDYDRQKQSRVAVVNSVWDRIAP
jgi:hypothetical protein